MKVDKTVCIMTIPIVSFRQRFIRAEVLARINRSRETTSLLRGKEVS